jgi:phosphate transport system substrate-binding protein
MGSKRFALAIAVAAAVALLAAGSGVASAACPAGRIDGIGSSLQRLAQERIWIPNFASPCSNVTVTYEPSGSGAGLEAWGANSPAAEKSERSGKEFIATDDAPTATQVGNIRTSGNGASVGVIPVASAAISVIVKQPAHCTISEIRNEDLEAIFRRTKTFWREVSTARPSPAECGSDAITRVVRRDVSGTTYQFKHYNWLIFERAVEGSRTWLDLQGATTPSDNTEWPSSEASEPVKPASNGGGALVTQVREGVAGAIGYASITDSSGATGITILRVNNGLINAEPVVSGESNCEVPARENLGRGSAVTERVAERTTDWTTIYSSDPNVRGTKYPICTLTWIGAYLRSGATSGYQTARLGGSSIGEDVREYVSFALEGTQQGRLAEKRYGRLPTAILNGARVIAGNIG